MKHEQLTYQIIGCALEVHKSLGNGFQEVIYQRAMALELNKNSLAYEREVEMPIYYSGVAIGSRRVDFLVERIISVEMKAAIQLEAVHMAQALNYLEAFNLENGLLLNFGSTSLQVKRLLNKKYVIPQPPHA